MTDDERYESAQDDQAGDQHGHARHRTGSPDNAPRFVTSLEDLTIE